MAEILNRLSTIQNTPTVAVENAKSVPSQDPEKERLSELEKQVSEMTQKRIDHLEKIQEQQMHWQVSYQIPM